MNMFSSLGCSMEKNLSSLTLSSNVIRVLLVMVILMIACASKAPEERVCTAEWLNANYPDKTTQNYEFMYQTCLQYWMAVIERNQNTVSQPRRHWQSEYGNTYNDSSSGIPVYSPDECVGPIINGECHGSIIPKAGYRKKCYGDWIGGQCTGPMF